MQAETVSVLRKTELTSLRWIILAGGLVAILTVLIVAAYLRTALEREAFQNWQQQNQPLAETLAGQIDQEIGKSRASLRLLASLPEFQQLQDAQGIDRSIGGIAATSEMAKRHLLDLQMAEYPDFSVLFMLKANGDHYLAHPFSVQQSVAKYNMSDRAYFKETLRTRDTVISDSFFGADGKLAVAINTPIKQADGRIAAHLGGVFHLERLSRLLRQLDIAAFDELILVDQRGELIGQNSQAEISSALREAFLERPEIEQLFAVLKGRGTEEVTFQELRHPTEERSCLTFAVPLKSGWKLIVIRDKAAVLTALQPSANIITATTALILLSIAGVGLAFMSAVGKRWEQAEQALKSAKLRLEAELEEGTRELSASHEHIQLLLDSSGAGILGVDSQGRCTFYNSACIEILSFPTNQNLKGRPLHDIIQHCHGDGTPYFEADSPILDAIRMDKRIYREHEIFCAADGQCVPVEYRAYPMHQQGQVIGAVVTFNDISARIHTNALLQAVIDQAPFAITIGEGTTDNWSLTLANQEAQRITGATAEQQRQIRFISGELSNPDKRSWQMLHIDGTPIQVQDTPLVKAMSEHRVTRNKEMVIRRPDGVETYVLGNAAPVYSEDGRHIAGIFIYPDITDLKLKEETIKTLSQAMEQSPVSVIITDPDGVIEYTNGGFERSSGYTSEEVLGKHTRLLRSEHTAPEHYKQLWDTLTSGEPWQGEFQNRRKDGSLFWEYAHLSPIFDDRGHVRHYLAVKEDITIRKLHEEKILHQAHYDSLTGLPNRFLALDRLSQILRNAQREDHLAAVLFLDLDDFKKVNDTLGHGVGDQVIEEAARRVRWSVREEDTVGRLGGDEFIVLLAKIPDKAAAAVVGEKILAAFRSVFRLGEREILLTTSIGISVYPDDGDDLKLLLQNADTAMYHSKAVGRNAYHFYTDAMNRDVARCRWRSKPAHKWRIAVTGENSHR